MTEIPQNSREKEQSVPDDARKFIVRAGKLNQAFLDAHGAKIYTMVTDWIDIGDDTETKLVHKTYHNGSQEWRKITKRKDADGSRRTDRDDIDPEAADFPDLTKVSLKHLVKQRSTFRFEQGGILYEINYDSIPEKGLIMLEVDAVSKSSDDRTQFDPRELPLDLIEVSGDPRYEGWRVADL